MGLVVMISLTLMALLGGVWWAADWWLSLRSIAIKVGDGEWSQAGTGWAMFVDPNIWPMFLAGGVPVVAIAGIILWVVFSWLARVTQSAAYSKRLKKLKWDEWQASSREASANALLKQASDQIDQAKKDVNSARENAAKEVKKAANAVDKARKGLARERKSKLAAAGKATRMSRKANRLEFELGKERGLYLEDF